MDMETVKQDRDESITARVERAQLAVERTLVFVANAQDALFKAAMEIRDFETREDDGRKETPSDAAATDLIGSTIAEMIYVSGAVIRMAKHTVDEAFDGILHNSGRMQYWLERESFGK